MIDDRQFERELKIIIDNALREDIGDGDHSSLACIPHENQGKAALLVKEAGIIAGIAFAERVFKAVDANLAVQRLIEEGCFVKPGEVVLRVSGNTHAILKAERLVLNAVQRMSAIATKTHRFVNLLKGTRTKILDTRKTTPGLRALEKWAVKIGGGVNHRFALYDAIMLKDNHLDFAGGIAEAIRKTQHYLNTTKKDLKIIVEARNLQEVREILSTGGVDRILLDNFNFEDTRKAVALIGQQCQTESSGGIDEQCLRSYAECGVDFISCGALTHSISNLDLSLKAC